MNVIHTVIKGKHLGKRVPAYIISYFWSVRIIYPFSFEMFYSSVMTPISYDGPKIDKDTLIDTGKVNKHKTTREHNHWNGCIVFYT